MKRKNLVLMISILWVTAASAPVLGENPDFNVNVPAVKIAEGRGGWIPTYGVGDSMVVDGSNVYVSFGSTDVANADEIRITRSFDGGVTWTASKLIASRADYDGNGSALGIGLDPADPARKKLHVVWGSTGPSPALWYSSAVVLGSSLNWSSPIQVSGTETVEGFTRSIAVDSAGVVHVVYLGRSTNSAVFYTKSADGVTFDVPVELWQGTSRNVDVDVDDADDVFVAWEGDRNVWVSKLAAGSGSWSTPVMASAPGDGYDCAVAAYDANTVCTSWGGWNGGIVVSCSTDGGASWNPQVLGPHWLGEAPSLAFDVDGTLNLAFAGYPVSGSPSRVYFARTVHGLTKWTSVAAINDMDVSFTPNLTVDGGGKAFIVYTLDIVGGVYTFDTVYLAREQ